MDKASTNTLSKIALQHIVKLIATEKMSNAILDTDLNINKSFCTKLLSCLLDKILLLIIRDAVSKIDKIL
jgi:hypothetical protein